MAEIGDKSFTTDMIQLIKDAVKAELGTNAFVNRYLAEVTVVNSTTSEITVKLSGSDVATDGFRSRGLQLPSVGDQVIACVDGQDRWIESVIRPATSTPYLQISSGAITGAGAPTGSVVGWLTATAPTGWLFCDGTSYAYNTYPALGALLGGSAGGNFNVPDMRDRILGGKSAVGTWSNTTGTIGPNTTITGSTHLAHTHTLDHTHGHNFAQGAVSVANHDAHYHTANPGAGTTGDGTSNQARITVSATSTTYASLREHTHSFDAPSDLTSQPQNSGGTATAISHSVTNGSLTGSVSALGTSTTTAGLSFSSAANDRTLKSTLLNFIIKT